MTQALAGYMEQAAEKLRAEGMHCRHVTLFIRTSPFNDKEPYYDNQISTRVAIPTNDTRVLLALIGPLLSSIWRDGHRYLKGGVMLADFTPDCIQQDDLFTSEQQGPSSNALMQVVDKINKEGMGRVYFGTRGRDTSEWMMKRGMLSPRYTTMINELPIATV